jgi:hypothetical protein
MIVARYEMPGSAASRNPSRRARCDRVAKGVLLYCTINKAKRPESYRSLRDGSFVAASQALHAWTSASSVESLPSFRPFGTIHLQPNIAPKRWLRNDTQASP